MVRKLTGQKAHIFIDDGHSAVITSGATEANTKYFVMDRAEGSAVPVPEGMFFQSPRTGTQITLVEGDRIYLIDEERFCKTNASFEFSQGSVDVGDDCHPASSIPDGITAFSGSFTGLFRYDPVSEEFENVTKNILNKLMTVVHDSGTGAYDIYPHDNVQAYILTLLNSDGNGGQYENWLFAPIVITSMSVSLGHADPQSKDISFTLGHGSPMIYRVPVAAQGGGNGGT